MRKSTASPTRILILEELFCLSFGIVEKKPNRGRRWQIVFNFSGWNFSGGSEILQEFRLKNRGILTKLCRIPTEFLSEIQMASGNIIFHGS